MQIFAISEAKVSSYKFSNCAEVSQASNWGRFQVKNKGCGPIFINPQASYYNWSFHWICLCANSSAVFRSRGTNFGKEVGGGRGKSVGPLVTMETDLLPQETGYALTAQLIGRWCWIFACGLYCGLEIHLQKMSEIYHVVPEIAHSNLLDNWGPGGIGDRDIMPY